MSGPLLCVGIADGDGVYRPIIKAHDSIRAILPSGALLYTYQRHTHASLGCVIHSLLVNIYYQNTSAIGLFHLFDVCVCVYLFSPGLV
jgi:hypothetical protein